MLIQFVYIAKKWYRNVSVIVCVFFLFVSCTFLHRCEGLRTGRVPRPDGPRRAEILKFSHIQTNEVS